MLYWEYCWKQNENSHYAKKLGKRRINTFLYVRRIKSKAELGAIIRKSAQKLVKDGVPLFLSCACALFLVQI